MKIIDSQAASASFNMSKDLSLLNGLKDHQEEILHFYDWQRPSVTYGCLACQDTYLTKDLLLDIAKRPTGGGIIFHITDFTFSVLIPAISPRFSLNTLQNYRHINECICAALKLFQEDLAPYLLTKEKKAPNAADSLFCMAKPTCYDVMVKDKKVAGGALKRTRYGYLYQGSISVAQPPMEMIKEAFLPGFSVLSAMQANSYFLINSQENLLLAKNQIKECLKKAFLAP